MHHARTLFLLLGTLALNATYASDDYVFSYSTAPYEPLTDPIVVVTNAEFNGTYRYVPIGFDFTYWDQGHTAFTFNTHGYCAFGLSPNYGFYPFNLGLVGIGDSQVGYVQDLSGGPGHGILKVEWKHVGFYSFPDGTDHVSWQVWLYEGSNAVELHFARARIDGGFGADERGDRLGFRFVDFHVLLQRVDEIFLEILRRQRRVGDFAEGDDGVLVVVAIDSDLLAGGNHPGAMRGEQDEIEAILDLLDAIFDCDARHGGSAPAWKGKEGGGCIHARAGFRNIRRHGQEQAIPGESGYTFNLFKYVR